jgi:hypothetical protein
MPCQSYQPPWGRSLSQSKSFDFLHVRKAHAEGRDPREPFQGMIGGAPSGLVCHGLSLLSLGDCSVSGL